jgi:hypothetical protein
VRASAETGWARSVGTVDTENLSDKTGLQPLEQVLGHSGEEVTVEISMTYPAASGCAGICPAALAGAPGRNYRAWLCPEKGWRLCDIALTGQVHIILGSKR